MNVAGGVVLDVRQLLRKHRKPTDSLDDVPGRSTYLEPMMSWRPEKWSHLKNPSEEKEKKKKAKLDCFLESLLLLFSSGTVQKRDTMCCEERVRATVRPR